MRRPTAKRIPFLGGHLLSEPMHTKLAFVGGKFEQPVTFHPHLCSQRPRQILVLVPLYMLHELR